MPYAKEYLQEDNTATFKNLKFLSKKKEEICRILLHKKMEELRNTNKSVKAHFEKAYSKEFNETARKIMNSVRLCFEAFEDDNDDIRLCEPLYSDPICNQKAASKGELKIHRISSYSGSWKGGDDMILLCDRVQKENIEIHFFETDSDQNIIWETKADFSPLNVHYQVAIYFKTPKYKENSDRKVSIRLARNGEYSESLEFLYVGDDNENPSKKRKKYAESVYQFSTENVNSESSSSSSCNAETSVYPQQQINNSLDLLNLQDLPADDILHSTDFTLLGLLENSSNCYSGVPSFDDLMLQLEGNPGPVGEMDVAAKQDDETSLSNFKSGNKYETNNQPQWVPQGGEIIEEKNFDFGNLTPEEILVYTDKHRDDIDGADGVYAVNQVDIFAVKPYDETSLSSLKSVNKSKTSNHNQLDCQKVKEKICGHLMKRNEFGNTFLHTAVCKLESIKTIKSILQLIKFTHCDIINEKNFYQETALHFAVEQNNVELIKNLLRHGSNPNLTNAEGNNCYHIASEYNHVDAMNSLFAVVKYSQQDNYKPEINAFNYEGLTPLHISVMKHSEGCYNLLKSHLGDVNIRFPKSGKTLLHYAVEFHQKFVGILLKENEIDINIQDFEGNTPLHIACATGKIEIVKQLLKAGADPSVKNYKQNCNTLDEESSEDDMDGQTPANVTTNVEILEILKQEPCNISGTDEIIQKLCDLLDVDMKWKAIAAFVIDEKYINSLLCSPSPTRALLKHMKKEYKDSYIECLKNVLQITGPHEALKIIQENHF